MNFRRVKVVATTSMLPADKVSVVQTHRLTDPSSFIAGGSTSGDWPISEYRTKPNARSGVKTFTKVVGIAKQGPRP